MVKSITRRSAERSEGSSASHEATGSSDSRQSPYWRVWAPLLARGAAIGLALLGLAGIGLAAARSESSSQLVRAPFSAGLAQLVGGGAGVPARAATERTSAVAAAPSTETAPSAETAPVAPAPPPCPPSARDTSAHAAGARAEPDAGPAAAGRGLTADGRVILNRASVAELQRLPGVGAKRAAAILQLRQRLGRFRRPSDLLRIKGIGPRLLERMLPRLVLDE